MRWAIVVGLILVLLLASCVKEQHAIPLNSNVSQAPVAQPAQQPAPQPSTQPATQPANKTTATSQPAQPQAQPANKTQSAPQQNQTAPLATNTSSSSNVTALIDAFSQLPPGKDGCVETDNGDYQYVAGTINVRQGNTTIIKSDECLGNALREWYCDLSTINKKIYVCSKGCANGACIQ